MRGDFQFPSFRLPAGGTASIAGLAAASTTAALPTTVAGTRPKFVMVWADTSVALLTGIYLEFGDATVVVNTATAAVFQKGLFDSFPLIVNVAGCTHVAVRTIGADATVKVSALDNW